MGEHTVKQVVYFRQKQGRSAHLKGSVDPLSEEHSKSQARQRYTTGEEGHGRPLQWGGAQLSEKSEARQRYIPGEECRCPAWGGEQGSGGVNHVYRTILLSLCISWPIILFVSSHLTGPWTLPRMQAQIFSKMDPTAEAYGCMSRLIMGGDPSPFDPQVGFQHIYRQGNFPWPQEWALNLCFSRAQLLPLTLILECLGGYKDSILLHLTNTRCPAQMLTLSYLNMLIPILQETELNEGKELAQSSKLLSDSGRIWTFVCPAFKSLSLEPPPLASHQLYCATAAKSLQSCLICAAPETAAREAPPSLGFSRQELWSGLPFPSPVHESEKWKWRCSVVSDS